MDDERLPGQMSLQYDEFSDLLGGAVWEEALDRWSRSGFSMARQQTLRSFASYFSSSPQFLFSEDRQRYSLELFWLKWNLFTGLCRRIQGIHQEHQRPLLNLQPAHLRLTMAAATEPFLAGPMGFFPRYVESPIGRSIYPPWNAGRLSRTALQPFPGCASSIFGAPREAAGA
ncbi:MAG: hypothetical protein MPW15_23115 [Candidatus Manganitrophus sp.]|nr:hypothetical protein [Candidatus Manganitrophus sp.]